MPHGIPAVIRCGREIAERGLIAVACGASYKTRGRARGRRQRMTTALLRHHDHLHVYRAWRDRLRQRCAATPLRAARAAGADGHSGHRGALFRRLDRARHTPPDAPSADRRFSSPFSPRPAASPWASTSARCSARRPARSMPIDGRDEATQALLPARCRLPGYPLRRASH
jgi:hypothetical protein